MKPLGKTLLRDLLRLRGQVVAAALVVACGVGVGVAMQCAYLSLEAAKADYYESYRFADVFARLKRAPQGLAEQISAIPGVAQVRTRVVEDATLDVPGVAEPVTGRLVSIPEVRQPVINDLFLRRGRYIEPSRPDEALVSEAFAQANKLEPGDKIGAILNGRRRDLTVVGIALAPEYVYEVGQGMLFPDSKRFGVLWMGRGAMASAFNMEGAFNDVLLRLAQGANRADVTSRLDQMLLRYGGLSAYGREEQLSNRFLTDELSEIEISATFIPAIFMGVAIFLIYIILSRLVAMQRTQIGLLKAFGYPDWRVALHYLEFALADVLIGVLPGLALGVYLGGKMTALYAGYFHFPQMVQVITPGMILLPVAASLLAACAGAIGAVRQVTALSPAEAMRPEAPARFRAGVMERSGAARWLPSSMRMIIRNLVRRPWKAVLSVLGIGMAVGLMLVARFIFDVVDHMMYVQFNLVNRQDVTVTFHEPKGPEALYALERLPGVLLAEPFRAVPVRLRHEHRSKQVQLDGLPADSRLHRLVDNNLHVLQLPPEGMLLTRKLGNMLGITVGDRVTVEVLEGERLVREVPVVGLSDEQIGIGAYMDARALASLLREGSLMSGAYLKVDPLHADELYARLKHMPAVSGVTIRGAMIESVREIINRTFKTVAFIETLFAAMIVIGMVYNSVRIALSERSNELASLRVLGFTQGEVAALLLGEQALLTLCAIPVGLLIGYGMCALLVPLFDRELFRLPLVFGRMTLVYPAVATLVSAMLSALLVARRLRRLDLIAVLKTRE